MGKIKDLKLGKIPHERHCKLCKGTLSIYNPYNTCFHHALEREEIREEKKAKHTREYQKRRYRQKEKDERIHN